MNTASGQSSSRAAGLTVLFLALLWVDFMATFRLEWTFDEQYRYGWITPLLALYLLRERWLIRPLPSPGWGAELIIALGLLLLFPLHIILGSNPEWRLALWCYAGVVFMITLALLWQRGGLPWLTHFAPAFALMLFAVPWPIMIEQPVTQGLMRLVAAVVVETMNLAGVYAEQSGNLIRLREGWVGVEEACSGVRSLQSTLMSAWFIGELFRFTLGGRLLLIALGALASLGLNLLRTLTLTWLTHTSGPQVMDDLHDPVGHIIAAVAFILLLVIARLIRKRFVHHTGRTRAPLPRHAFITSAGRVWVPVVWIVLLALTHVATMGWYRQADRGNGRQADLVVDWGLLRFEPEFRTIPPAIRAQLRYTEGAQVEWVEPGLRRVKWTVFDFAWDDPTISPFVGVHRPDTCLPASGFTPTGSHAPLYYERDGQTLKFSATSYRYIQTPVQVFYATWDGRGNEPLPLVETAVDRLRLAWSGRRITSKRSLQIVMQGIEDPAEARHEAGAFLDKVLRRE